MKVHKPIVLSISALQIMALAVMTPIIPKMSAEFPDADMVLIKAMVTIPAVCILFTSQISGWLSSFVRKKSLVVTGLIFYFIGGVGAYFTNSIYQMIICRLVLGIGIGFIMPMATGLIADFYSGTERTQTLGYSQAVNYFGGVLATLLSGYIAMYNWRNVFLIFILSILILLLVLIGLPEPERRMESIKKYRILPKSIYFLGLCAVFQMIVFYSCATNIAVRLKEIGINNTFASSLGIGALYLGCFFSGSFLTKVLTLLKQKTVFAAIITSALGFMLIGASQSEILNFTGMILAGVSDGVIIPYIYSSAARNSTREDSGQAMAVIVASISIGQFLAPLVFQAIIIGFGNNTVAGGFIGMSVLIILASFAALAISYKPYNHEMERL